MSPFRAAFHRLANAGVLPDNGSAGSDGGESTALIQHFNGYKLGDLLAAAMFGVLVTITSFFVISYLLEMSIIGHKQRMVIEAVRSSGIDVTALSSADLTARLAYSPEDGRTLVEAFTSSHPGTADYVLAALQNVPIERRRPMMEDVVQIVQTFSKNADKERFLNWSLSLNDETAKRVVSMGLEISPILERLSSLSRSDRETILAAGFPIKPVDLDRANLWRIINMPGFPANALVLPMAAAAKADPADLSAIYTYLQSRRATEKH